MDHDEGKMRDLCARTKSNLACFDVNHPLGTHAYIFREQTLQYNVPHTEPGPEKDDSARAGKRCGPALAIFSTPLGRSVCADS
jgi:hypothetical protein